MSSVLARDGEKLLLAWDVRQDIIEGNEAMSSSGPVDQHRIMLKKEDDWKRILALSPYRVTYVTFERCLFTDASQQKVGEALHQIQNPIYAQRFQFLVDIAPVAGDDITSEDGNMGLAFCTAKALKERTSDIGLLKRFHKRLLDDYDGRAILTYLTTEDVQTMIEERV